MKRLFTFLLALMLITLGASAQSTDVTEDYIQNPSFETPTVSELADQEEADGHGSYAVTDAQLTGWTLTGTGSSGYQVCDIMTKDASALDDGFSVPNAAADGSQWLYVRNAWAGTSNASASVMQSVTLPAGNYKVSVDNMCISGATTYSVTLTVGDIASASLPINTATPDAWNTTSVKFTLNDETTLNVGVSISYGTTNASGLSVLLDNFKLYEVNEMELTAHEEVDGEKTGSNNDGTNYPTMVEQFTHWSSTGNNGVFHVNDWSTESDVSGMVVPFFENWVANGSTLTAATISHTLVGLPAGTYDVSMDIRIFAESGADIGTGTTFNANGVSEDLDDTDHDGHEGSYGTETEVYGTYNLECEVGSDGLLNISLVIPDGATYNWIAFKNLKVVMIADDYPTVTPIQGTMDEEAKETMDDAIAAYEEEPSSDTFHAAIDAIQDAYDAIQKYGEIHDCEAEFDHWSISPSNSTTFQKNTWSTEDDPSGMKVPFIEYWKGSGNPLTDAVISHETITGIPGEIYSVSIDYRAFNENSDEVISQGSTFNVNTTSADLCVGTRAVFNGVSQDEYAIGYTVLCVADEETGAIDVNFDIKDADFDWFAFKNLIVKGFDGEWPELTAATGEMHTGYAEAQTTALAAYEATPTFDTYLAAFNAVNAAHLSALFYADVHEVVDKLDEAGLAKFDELTDNALSNKTLEYQDMTDFYTQAQLAQTTAGTDWTYVVLNTGTWDSSVSSLGTYSTGIEAYGGNGNNFAAGAYLCKNIEGLVAGATYEVTFDAVASATTWASGVTYGDGITQIYANDTAEDIYVIQQNSFDRLSDYPHTLTCAIGDDGALEFGLQNIATGANWYVAQAVSLTLVALADDADYAVGDEIDVHNFKGTVESGNLFVNGGFNNGVEGWTAGNKYTDALSESNVTIHQSGGYNDGPYVTVSNTGASNANVPTQAIAVEPGKSYLFVGYTNYSGDDKNLPDSRYSALFIMDSKTAERSHLEGETSYSDGLVELQFVNNGEWVKTEGVFTVPYSNEDGTFSYVGMRMNWSTASYDGLQLYEVEGAFTFPEDADYAIGDEVTISDVTYTVVSDNLVDNGSFNERTTGWTYGSSHAGDLYPYNVLYSTDGGYNDGPYITSRGGGSSANTTPSKEVDVVTGKTYLFVGYTNGTAPESKNEQYNGLFTMTSETAESGSAIIEMNWGDPDEELNGWTKTEAVFTAETDYVGLRFSWCPGACLDGFQIYQIAESEDIEWEMTEAGWGTLILPFDVAAEDVPSELTLYAGDALTLDGSTITVGDASETIAANTPYLVSGTEAMTYTFTGAPTNTEDSYTVGMLTGTLVDMTYDDFTADGTEYVLQDHGTADEGLAFYPIISESSSDVELDAYHCYLTLSGDVTPTALRLPGTATAIVAVESTEAEADGAIYDLSGRKVSKAVKGVYIQNGKKVLVK